MPARTCVTTIAMQAQALLTLCDRNPLVIGGFPSQRPVMRSLDIFFDLRLNKRLNTS